jgi:2-methylaconitate cis-trans-isomerase PrpF
MGLGATAADVPLSNPKVAVVSAPRSFVSLDGVTTKAAGHDLGVRMVSMERVHRAVTVTGALCIGVAAAVPGTVVHELAGVAGDVRLGNPSGVVVVGARTQWADNGVRVESAVIYRTARRLMQGQVAV